MTPERRRASRLLCRAIDLRKRGYDSKALGVIERYGVECWGAGYEQGHKDRKLMHIDEELLRLRVQSLKP